MQYLLFGLLLIVALFLAQIMSYAVLMNLMLTKRFMKGYEKRIARVYSNLDDSEEETESESNS